MVFVSVHNCTMRRKWFVVRDVEVLEEKNVVSMTGLSFILLLMSFINCRTLIRKSSFSSSDILRAAGIIEMKNAPSPSGAVLLLLNAFKISLSISCCNRDFFADCMFLQTYFATVSPHQSLLTFHLRYQVIVLNLPYLREYRLFVQSSLKLKINTVDIFFRSSLSRFFL